ncbi:hypothetical protein [Barnesiella intestinihominis]|uniref:hypothetical protein n=1 Tax=Barnesiella intestinihominis TaxID=487174 RepID=UPI0039678D56
MLEVRGVSLAQKKIIMKKESELFFGLLSLCLVVCLSACRSGDDEPSLEDVTTKLIGTWKGSMENYDESWCTVEFRDDATVSLVSKHGATWGAERFNGKYTVLSKEISYDGWFNYDGSGSSGWEWKKSYPYKFKGSTLLLHFNGSPWVLSREQ